MTTRKLELLIFDCDGVLVDSERIANEIFIRILEEECRLSFSLEEMFDTFVGHSAQYCLDVLEKMLGCKPPTSVASRYRMEINRALEQSVTAVQGIEQALAGISIPYCVASSGSYEKMHTTLGKTGLLKFFEGNLFSTVDVDRGKPYPDIYLHAAKCMGCGNPQNCLVIEDSPPGVEGGVAAGMVVFGYTELMKKERLVGSGAHHTFENMRNLPGEIAAYESNQCRTESETKP